MRPGGCCFFLLDPNHRSVEAGCVCSREHCSIRKFNCCLLNKCLANWFGWSCYSTSCLYNSMYNLWSQWILSFLCVSVRICSFDSSIIWFMLLKISLSLCFLTETGRNIFCISVVSFPFVQLPSQMSLLASCIEHIKTNITNLWMSIDFNLKWKMLMYSISILLKFKYVWNKIKTGHIHAVALSITWVGVMCDISSDASTLSNVVFPALSSPSRSILSSTSGLDLNFLSRESKP